MLLDKSDYIAKMLVILDDPSNLECLGGCDEHDNTGQNERALQAFLLRQHKAGLISSVIYDRIRPTGSVRPRMYGLPKVHKPHPFPLRPILSMVGSSQHEMARWLAGVLQPVLARYSLHVIKDSFSFCERLREKNYHGDDMFMCSFDVVSLFTNVPIDETIQICLDTLYRSNIPPPGIKEDLLKKLLLKSTKDVEFSFNNCMYRQIDGVAMGSPLGPVLANIFLGYCESLIPDEMWPDMYCRFVDDTFSLFDGCESAEEFLNCLNRLHLSLRFTMEGEKNNRLPFMDVLVIRGESGLSTTVYRKPTFTGLYTRWDSYCSTGQKIALVRSLAHRARKLCSAEHLQGEIEMLTGILQRNGYPSPIVERLIRQTLEQDMPIVRQQDKLDSQRVFVRLPWLGSASLALKRRIFKVTNDAIPLCAPVCVFTSKKMFHTNRKDVLSADNFSNVVYLFGCVCGHSYFGRTTQRLGERIRQHILAEMTKHVTTHAVSSSKKETGSAKEEM